MPGRKGMKKMGSKDTAKKNLMKQRGKTSKSTKAK